MTSCFKMAYYVLCYFTANENDMGKSFLTWFCLVAKGVSLIVRMLQLAKLKGLKGRMHIKDKGSVIAQEQSHARAAISQQKVNTQKTKQHIWLGYMSSEARRMITKGSKLETNLCATIETNTYYMRVCVCVYIYIYYVQNT